MVGDVTFELLSRLGIKKNRNPFLKCLWISFRELIGKKMELNFGKQTELTIIRYPIFRTEIHFYWNNFAEDTIDVQEY